MKLLISMLLMVIASGQQVTINGITYEAQNISSSTSLVQSGNEFIFQVEPGDSPLPGDQSSVNDRSELYQKEIGFSHGDDLTVSYQFNIGSFTNNASFFVIGQWHGGDNEGYSPYASVLLDGNDLKIEYRQDNNQLIATTTVQANISRNTWHTISMRTVTDSQNGILQVTLNGTQVVNYSGALGYTQQAVPGYWKFGIYRGPDSSTAKVKYRNVYLKKHIQKAISTIK